MVGRELKRRVRRLRRAVSHAARSGVGVLRGTRSPLERLGTRPLLIAEKTYNTFHPDYEPELVENFPNYIQNPERPCNSRLFPELSKLARRRKVPPRIWQSIGRAVMEEARTVPGFDQVMDRKAFIENYLADLGRRYRSSYNAGWVSLVDAWFLYWAVRTAKPKTIVQTGVSNGLSSAFMMLALARNGLQGRLHAIDLPHIFNPLDPAWIRPDIVYGVAIPEGKSSGWMVPDIYSDRFKVECGDASELLPSLVDRLESIDMFYHDSDHTYAHMMFEFREVKRKLAPGGLIVADDISWNASLWDFADEHRVPSYNYRGSVGVAFF
jgi:predicted O-methyltransferase YrrM